MSDRREPLPRRICSVCGTLHGHLGRRSCLVGSFESLLRGTMRIGSSSFGGLSLVATLVAIGALIWAALVWHAAVRPAEDASIASEPASVEREDGVAAESLTAQSWPARAWPALFGEPAREPREPPAPPQLAHVGYALKGLITSGKIRWAIVAADGTDALVQEGDSLPGDALVEAIQPEGVWLRIGDRSDLVVFSNEAPVRSTSVEIGPREGLSGVAPQQIRTQSLSPTELRDIILKAEADRISRGASARRPTSDR